MDLYNLSEAQLEEMRSLYRSGHTPTQIIRLLISKCAAEAPGGMQVAFMNAFRLSVLESRGAVWWGEESHAEYADRELGKAIEAARPRWDSGVK
jgi:hypothetical protein